MLPDSEQDKDRPWWLYLVIGGGLYLLWKILADETYAAILATLSAGIVTTIMVTLVAFGGACVLGLALAVACLSRFLIIRQATRFYIEVMRGIPIVVLLLYVAFVGAPALVVAVNWLGAPLGLPEWRTRDFPLLYRAIVALVLAYSAFLAEVFRAGLQAVDRGQIEAAQALGLSGWQRFRCIVLPQAFRLILPPLGNDFVAMIKDSSLVAVLGVGDVAQLGKVTAAGNFLYLETYNVVAFIYLTMTISLSLLMRRLEIHLRSNTQRH